jgi:hypothetical protein
MLEIHLNLTTVMWKVLTTYLLLKFRRNPWMEPLILLSQGIPLSTFIAREVLALSWLAASSENWAIPIKLT